MIGVGNLPIRVFGQSVRLVYRSGESQVASNGVDFEAPSMSSVDAVAVVTPGVPETLRVDESADRWVDPFTFYVDGSVEDAEGRPLVEIGRASTSFKVSTIRDWGASFVCVGERVR